MLDFDAFEQVGRSQGSNDGGKYRRDDGTEWYLKYPNSERQGHNEVMASWFYREMGFDALEYRMVDNGMVASEWREGLPSRSDVAALQNSDTVQEAFLPSALIANWDVIGLVADNCLYDPDTMSEPVFLDFGGSFDTRAMGGHKDFTRQSVPALEGFTDPSINQSAARVFEGMTADLWSRSKARIDALTVGNITEGVRSVPLNGGDDRIITLEERQDILKATDYEEVF